MYYISTSYYINIIYIIFIIFCRIIYLLYIYDIIELDLFP